MKLLSIYNEILLESIKNSISFQPIQDDNIYNILKNRRFSDEANRNHTTQFKAKNGQIYYIKKEINYDKFNVYDKNYNNIAVAVFDTTNKNYFTGYEHNESIQVNPNFRRLGVATAITKFAENFYKLPYKPSNVLSQDMQGFTKQYLKENKIILKSKSDKGNRYFEMLKTAKFQHYDSPKGELSIFNKGEEDRKRLVSKLSQEDKKKYKEWLTTPEGKESLKLWKKYETKFNNKVLNESINLINPFKESKIQFPVYHFNHKNIINPYKKDKFGYFFTDEITFGERYFGKEGIKIHKCFINLKNPFITSYNNLKLIFKKPLANQLDDNNQVKENWFEERVDDFINSNSYEREIVFNFVRQNNYDGLILPEDWDGGMGIIKSYVVFNENQIKKID